MVRIVNRRICFGTLEDAVLLGRTVSAPFAHGVLSRLEIAYSYSRMCADVLDTKVMQPGGDSVEERAQNPANHPQNHEQEDVDCGVPPCAREVELVFGE